MARIAGVDLPKNKRMEIALTYIFGIGRKRSIKILKEASIDINKNSDELTDMNITTLRNVIENNYTVEGDLRRDISMNIKRISDLKTYKGVRHKKKLPVRGQRTSSNARTRKGKAVAIAGKKSIKSMK